jgi:hypothetical protein
MRNLWCLEKNSILPFIISATGIVPQSLFKNLKILDLENTLVVEIQKGILLYSCHIVQYRLFFCCYVPRFLSAPQGISIPTHLYIRVGVP